MVSSFLSPLDSEEGILLWSLPQILPKVVPLKMSRIQGPAKRKKNPNLSFRDVKIHQVSVALFPSSFSHWLSEFVPCMLALLMGLFCALDSL